MLKPIYLLIPLLIVGCATDPATMSERKQQDQAVAQHNATTADNKDRLVCRKEKKTGSHRPIKICRTVRQIEADKISARTELERNKVRDLPSN